jgi:hypothetical protein
MVALDGWEGRRYKTAPFGLFSGGREEDAYQQEIFLAGDGDMMVGSERKVQVAYRRYSIYSLSSRITHSWRLDWLLGL